MFKRLAVGSAVAGTAGSVYGYNWIKQEMGADAVDRLSSFYKVVVPCFFEYKLLELKCETLPSILPHAVFPPVTDDEERELFEPLHRKWSPVFLEKFLELRGFYLKIGQRIATNAAELCPKQWQDEMEPLLDHIPPRPFPVIRGIAEKELGQPLAEVFSSFDEEPLGCASIGQTHRATLKSTGQHVVVKVQDPEAERTFRGDVFALKRAMEMFLPQFSKPFNEIEKQFGTEFDYRREAQNAEDVRANLEKEGSFDYVVIPKVYPNLCRKRVLVMDEIYPATPLHIALDRQAESMAKSKGMTKKQLMDEMEAMVQAAVAKGELLGNHDAKTMDRYIVFQQAKARSIRFFKHAYNWTVGWIAPNFDLKGESAQDGNDDVFVPLNNARIIDQLFAVHGHEILVDGVFNADPHPGNVLYIEPHNSKTGSAQLGLIDYGQVKRLSQFHRLGFCKMLLLVNAAIPFDPRNPDTHDPVIHERAKASIFKMMRSLGFKTTKNDPQVMYEMATVYWGRDDLVWLRPRNFLQWSDWIQARDPAADLDGVEDVVLPMMTMLMLRGLGHVLQQHRNTAVEWESLATRSLKHAGMLAEVEGEIASWRQ